MLHIKKQHGIDQKVRHGEGDSAVQSYVHIAKAGLPLLLRDISPYDQYSMRLVSTFTRYLRQVWPL
jgi:hypothetical protein